MINTEKNKLYVKDFISVNFCRFHSNTMRYIRMKTTEDIVIDRR